MNYHDIGVTICNTLTKAGCPLSEDQRGVMIGAVAVWLCNERNAALDEAAKAHIDAHGFDKYGFAAATLALKDKP